MLLASVGLATWLVACTNDGPSDGTYMCDAYFGSYNNQPTPNATVNIVAVDENGATLACQKSAVLEQEAMAATGSDKLACMCTMDSD